MPFPKEWQSKPKIVARPHSANDTIACHNCYMFWPKEYMNPCNGLCGKCIEENPVPIREVRERRSSEHQNNGCHKCQQSLTHTNFGICRDVCDSCKVDHNPLRQRCRSCNRYKDDCWNNVCSGCRSNKIFCENVGHFYVTSIRHDRTCWCVDHEILMMRQGIPY